MRKTSYEGELTGKFVIRDIETSRLATETEDMEGRLVFVRHPAVFHSEADAEKYMDSMGVSPKDREKVKIDPAEDYVLKNRILVELDHPVVIVFRGESKQIENDLPTLCDNLLLYPEFSIEEDKDDEDVCDMDFEDHTVTARFTGIWTGDPNNCIRLTHHAEGLYEDTEFEYVHVEVQIDGTWYGTEK